MNKKGGELERRKGFEGKRGTGLKGVLRKTGDGHPHRKGDQHRVAFSEKAGV